MLLFAGNTVRGASRARGALWVFRALVVLVTLEGCAGPDPASLYQEDPEALARGRAVFVGTCSGYCHGVGIAVGDVPNLFDCSWIHGGSNQEIYNTIANGVADTRMVGFAGKLPGGDEDIWKIIAFLKSESSGC
jgi:mono/diheme cytochrome c family protein